MIMSGTREWPARCQRCLVVPPEGLLSVSRTTRDEGAEILVCNRCGKREAFAGLVPYADWPLSLDALLDEERVVLTAERESSPSVIDADKLV